MITTKEKLISEVQLALQEERYNEALTLSNQLIRDFNDDDQSYLMLGDVYLKMGNVSKSIAFYEKALEINPGYAISYFKLGNAYEMEDNPQAALNQYQTAAMLEPDNYEYKGSVGNLLYRKGKLKNDFHLLHEGLITMEEAVSSGESSQFLKDELANAHLDLAYATWNPHPENEGEFVATEYTHLVEARSRIGKAKELTDGSNFPLLSRIRDMEEDVNSLEKRKSFGRRYIQKVPIIAGIILLIFGATGWGIAFLVLAVLYFFSQRKPVYLANRMYYKNNYREPFVMRRIQETYNYLSGFSFIGSIPNVFLMTTITRIVVGFFSYCMVLMMLPYEIIKGFIVNYDLIGKIMQKK